MKAIYNRFQNLSIKHKIIIYCFVVFLSIFFLIATLYSGKSAESITEIANDTTVVIIEQAQTAVELYLSNIEKIVEGLAEDSNCVTFCEKGVDSASSEISLCRDYNTVTNRYDEVIGIALISSDNRVVSNKIYNKNQGHYFLREKWYRKCVSYPNETQLFSSPNRQGLEYLDTVNVDDILCIAKAVKNKEGDTIGVIFVDTSLSVLSELMKNVVPGRDGFLMMYDKDDNTIFAPINNIAPRINADWFDREEGIIEKRVFGNDYQIMYTTSEKYEWKTVGVFSLTETLDAVNNTKKVIGLILIPIILLAWILMWIFAEMITKPVIKLTGLMKKAEEGDLSVRFHAKYKDEVGVLGNTFNVLIGQINSLIDMVYKEQEEKRKAELFILQQQIKPHFLYNTLDTIHWMAKNHEAEDIIDVVDCLSKFFRLSLSNGSEIITLRDEVAHVENYLQIQKIRYPEILSYKIILNTEIDNLYIQKLLLQPIVENALYHGIKEKLEPCLLLIQVDRENSKLIITISDDGVGMSEEKLKKLRASLISDTGEKGFGLRNVNQRIKLTTGSSYGVKVDSEENLGTTVTVIYPVIQEKHQLQKKMIGEIKEKSGVE